jgi:hypothetical protein
MPAQPTQSAAFVVPADLFARHQTITGLRALADFLEANPAVPVEEYGWTLSHHMRGRGDDCERAEVGRIAALLDATPVDDTGRGGHLVVSKTFGRITYKAVHIPARQIAEHDARMSYRNNITLDTDPAPLPAAEVA